MQKEELKDQFTDLLSKFTTYFGKVCLTTSWKA